MVAPFTASVDDFFIRQYGAEGFTPIDWDFRNVGESMFIFVLGDGSVPLGHYLFRDGEFVIGRPRLRSASYQV